VSAAERSIRSVGFFFPPLLLIVSVVVFIWLVFL
jgi:hypothetical protein